MRAALSAVTQWFRDAWNLLWSLKGPYILLVAIIALAIAFYVAFINTRWVTDWSAELGGGLFASLVIIFLIDRTLEGRKQQEEDRVRAVALTQLRIPLMRQLDLLAEWYKGTLPARPEPLPSSYEEVFRDDFYERIRTLDLSKTSPTVIPTQDWLQYSASEMGYFENGLERVIDKYATFLDAPTIELLQQLSGSSLVYVVVSIGQTPLPSDTTQRLFAAEPFMTWVREHVTLLLRLLVDFNARSPEPILFEPTTWHEDLDPKFGSLRGDDAQG